MGNCQRRQRGGAQAEEEGAWEVLPEEEAAGAEAAAPPAAAQPATAQLDALTSVRRLPARRRPGQAPPSSQDRAVAALRYRFGCRWHYLHALRVQASQTGPAQPAVKFAFLALRRLMGKKHAEDGQPRRYLRQLRGE